MFIKNDFTGLSGKYILVDNDFLSFLFEDGEHLYETLKIFTESFLTIDPFTKLEFLRDVFVPQNRRFKEDFISHEEVFCHAESHPEIFNQIQENALLLSKVFAHNRSGKSGCSTVDLLLAGRAMLQCESSAIITGNKKDFPSSVFDTNGILSYETKEGNIRSFSVIAFNKEKYLACDKALNRLER